MRQHPIRGVEILRPVERLREMASLIRLHSRDGARPATAISFGAKKYPSLGARILAMVDNYGARCLPFLVPVLSPSVCILSFS